MSVKVHWLDSFPDEWTVVPAKRLFTESKLRADITDEQLTASQDYGVIPQKEFIRRAGRSVVQINQHLDKRKRVEKDDFVISMRSFQGGLERAWASGGIRSSYVVLKPSPAVDVGYFAHLFKSQQYIQALQATANFIRDGQDLSFQNFTLVDLPLPPLKEQTQIAKFLDYETAKIDALIAKQQQLIALLQEKRQAVISHAVTKGLNPAAPLRDSGVEWLGEVPAHWTMKRLKHISPQITVGIVVNPSTFTTETGLPFIHGGDIREGEINATDARRISPDTSAQNAKTKLAQGDVLTVRVGATRGITAVVPPECEGGNCASVMLIRKGDFNSYWLCFVMNTRLIQFQIELVEYGAAQPQFNISHATEFKIPTPERDEQNKIVDYLNKRTAVFKQLISKAEAAVELLQERRTALIAAAVTGKIDVRGWQPPPAAGGDSTIEP